MSAAANLEQLHELSPIQHGLLIESSSAAQADPYVVQMSCRLRGRLDASAFARAWQSAVDRHEVLRASFHWRGLSHPVQAVQRRVAIPVEVVERPDREALLERDRLRGFDHGRAPLMRVTLGRDSGLEHMLVWTHHHLLLDGWSVARLLGEVLGTYAALARGEQPDAPPPAVPFSRYVEWLQQRDAGRDEAFWRGRLRGFAAPIGLDLDGRGSVAAPRWGGAQAEQTRHAGPELLAAVRGAAARHDCTLATALQAAWALLLRDHSRAADVVYGLTTSTRPSEIPGAARMLGPLINTLPVRIDVPAGGSVDRWLRRLQARQLEVVEHAHSALSDVQRWSELAHGGSLFDTTFAFENYPVDRDLRCADLEISEVIWTGGTAYPLTMLVVPDAAGTLALRYQPARFEAGTIGRLLRHYEMLLSALADATPDLDLSQLPSIAETERQRILVDFNATDAERATEPVHVTIATRARATPDAPAARCGDERLSYRELDRRSDAVAASLLGAGVARGERVAFVAPPTPRVLVEILGILKAGAAYVPLDPRDPPRRREAVLALARPAVVLAGAGPGLGSRPAEVPDSPVVTADDAAYVLFTSGTTGSPKGVVVPHGALANYLEWCRRAFALSPKTTSLAFSSPAVDLSVTALLGPLVSGGTVVFPDPALAAADLATVLREAPRVGLLKVTPSHLAMLGHEEALDALAARPPDHLVIGGERLGGAALRPWRDALPDTAIWNEYGPTEATVGCCAHRVPETLPDDRDVPIGGPVDNVRLYVLDAGRRPVPPGVTGELCVAGAGLALGYLDDPRLTAERFVPDPFGITEGGRLYLTGDLVRLDGGDRLVHVGRLDAQLKVRGRRVEPGEIEAHLLAHPAVARATVVARAGSTALAAFVVPAVDDPPAAAELARFLSARLPALMVPSSFALVEDLPRTVAGKVDRRALAELAVRPQGLPQPHVAPRNDAERVLAELWETTLAVDRIGVHDDFHHVGGDSLSAMRIVAEATARLGVRLTAGDVLDSRTIAGLAARLVDRAGAVPSVIPERPPVSAAQMRFFVLHELDPTRAAYNTFGAVKLGGPLSRDALHAAARVLVTRHEILRAVFRMVDGRLVQGSLPPDRFPLTEVDVSGHGLRRAVALARDDAAKPFDLAEGPLLRLRLYCLDERSHVLGLVAHHIVADGRSFRVMIGELARHYAASLRGQPAPVPAPSLTHAQIAQLERSDERRQAASLEYWRERLRGSPWAALQPDKPSSPARSYAAGDCTFRLDGERWAAVVASSRRNGVTPFVTLLAALRLVLHRFSGERDVVVGAAVARRETAGADTVVGPALNTVVLRARLRPERPLRDLLAREHATVAEALAHADLPFERLVDELADSREPTRTPLFQVMLDYQRADFEDRLAEGVTVEPLDIGHGAARFDLQLDAWESGDALTGRWTYATAAFDAATIASVSASFQRALQAIVEDPGALAGDLDLVGAEEHRRLQAQWRAGARELPGPPTVHGLVARQATRTPGAAAVVRGDRELTYAQLAGAARAWARRLRRRGVGAEQRVGVLMERSIEMVVAVLAVLEAGGAYVPLDPALPDARLRFMVADAGPTVIVASPRLARRATALGVELLVVGDEPPAAEAAVVESRCEASAANVAYVIYTSGSTGRPKGVAITHEAIRNRLLWMQDHFAIDATDRVLHKTAISFDVSVWELFWPLIAGACMVMAEPGGERDSAYLSELIAMSRVTTAHFVPSALGAFLDAGGLDGCGSLRRVLCSGEVLTGELRDRFHAAGAAALYNLYGPTEAAVDVTVWTCRRSDTASDVPIGRPIANTRIHVLDDRLRLVPEGAVGELCIGGPQVARGYVGRPGLTAERFCPDPFSSVPGMRLYRTGDRARYRRDGVVEFLGRFDDQVKIRGQRVELGEVDASLAAHPSVGECAVSAIGQGAETRLAAYYTLAGARPDPAALDGYLRARLPAAMVPSFFVELDELPRTPAGKIARRALPPPDPGARAADVFVPPATAAERTLATIWRDVLGVARVGANDSFFALGGDSIRALRMVARAGREGVHLLLADVFRHPSLAALARAAGTAHEALGGREPFAGLSATARRRIPDGVRDAYPLTALQAGMLFEAAQQPAAGLYQNVDSLHLRAPFDEASLHRAAQILIDRHDVLRTGLELQGHEPPLQLVHAHAAARVSVEDLRGLDPDEQRARILTWFEAEKLRAWTLSAPPLLRLHVHRRTEDEFQLSLPHHHAILDGWSLASLGAELAHTYLALLDGRAPALPPLPAGGFRAYVEEERRAEASEAGRDHWRAIAGDAAAGAFPAWLAFGAAPQVGYRTVDVDVRRATSDALIQLARAAGVPLKSALLAAHCEVVGATCGRTEVLTGVVTDGRLAVPGGDSVLGLFLNALPFRISLGTDPDHALLQRVFAQETAMVPHRHVPLQRILRDAGARRLFDTCFNFTSFHPLSELPVDGRLEVLDRLSFTLAGFPLMANLNLDPDTEVLTLSLTGDLRWVPETQLETIAEHYVRVLESMADGRTGARRPRPLLAGPALEERIAQSRGRRGGYPRDATIHALFEEQSRRRPDAVALTDGRVALSYGELNERANRLAHQLVARGVGPESVVALCAERSLEMVVALLAILKAGGAYLPLDPRAPAQRNGEIARDAAAVVVLAHERLSGRLPADCRPLWLSEEARSGRVDDPERGVRADNLCYVMTTSGTTGGPKGVRVEHRAVIRLVRGADYVELGPDETLLQISPMAFDVSTFELWGALLNGGRLVVPPPGPLTLAEIADVISRNRVTTLWLTAGLFSQIVSAQLGCLASVRQLLAGGDVVPVDAVRRVLAAYPACRMINGYGPTEATTFACAHTVIDPAALGATVPIGRPIANTAAYVCDRDLQLLPAGLAGELYLGGDAVARDYHDRPALTAARWRPDPFAGRPGSRVYASGDRARCLPDGTIEYLGRMDQQVKLHGLRVEPGEVEVALGRHAAVRAAAVVPREPPGGGRVLVAYVVAAHDAPLDRGELRRFLARRVPDYMIPAHIERLRAMPLTAAGKVDRRRLPPPARVRPDTPWRPPRTPIQELLASMWADLLGIDRGGLDDSFFELGGHSLIAMQLASRIRDALGLEIPLHAFFEQPTILGLESAVLAARADGGRPALPALAPRDAGRAARLSWPQQSIFELERALPGVPMFNMPMAIRIRGELDVDALRSALPGLVERHEVLRTRFAGRDGRAEQIVGATPDVDLPLVDLAQLAEEDRDAAIEERVEAAAHWRLDLTRGPPLRAEALRLAGDAWMLLLTLHHAVCDGWSTGIMASDLRALYSAARDGMPDPLAPLPVQYGDFAEWQRRAVEDGSLDGQLAYWRRRLACLDGGLELPSDRPRTAPVSLLTMARPVRLPSATLHALQRLGHRSSASLFMVLSAVFAELLGRRTRTTDVRLGTLSANRNRLETERVIGPFVNTLVLRLDVPPAASFTEILARAREATIDAFANQDLPFEVLRRSLEGELEDRTALFRHMLILQDARQRVEPVDGLALAPHAPFERQARIAATSLDLTLMLGEEDGELRGLMLYRPDLFDAGTVDEIVRELEEQLTGLATSGLEGEPLSGRELGR